MLSALARIFPIFALRPSALDVPARRLVSASSSAFACTPGLSRNALSSRSVLLTTTIISWTL
jgi:hypothetical protein